MKLLACVAGVCVGVGAKAQAPDERSGAPQTLDSMTVTSWRTLSGHPVRLRVHGVGPIAQQEGLEVLGRQQLDLVTQGTDHPRPVVGCAARLHRNQAALAPSEELGELGALDLPTLDLDGHYIEDV